MSGCCCTPSSPESSASACCQKEAGPKEVTTRRVACEGGPGPLGHPRVFINLNPEHGGVCGYCGQRFVLAADAASGH